MVNRHRTTPRSACALVLLVATSLTAAAVAAPPGEPAPGAPVTEGIVFPLIGKVQYWDNYGDARGNGAHAGIDIMNPRRTPVVAAEAGRIRWHTTSWRAGCMLYLYGKSGTTYIYIHLNNDRTLKNDNQAGCKAGTTYTVKDGAKVTAGEQIAWNGDSGDADGNPHLHFEVHPKDGRDVNPMPYLERATRLLHPGRLGTRFTLGLRGNAIAAGAGLLTLKVSSVRWWPNGRWTPIEPRTVEVAVAGTADVDEGLYEALQSPDQRTLTGRETETFTAFTAPAKVSPETQRGEPGTLTAVRVSAG